MFGDLSGKENVVAATKPKSKISSIDKGFLGKIPATKATNKHLFLVYDKPMFFYPLSFFCICSQRKGEI